MYGQPQSVYRTFLAAVACSVCFRAHLRRHPVRRADLGLPALVALDVGAEAEVCDLHRTVLPQQDVIRFDVPVDDTLQRRRRNHRQ